MMKHVVMIVVAIVFWLLAFVLKQHKEKVLMGGILVMTLISGIYSFTHAEGILPSRDAKTQTLYHTDYLENGEFSDAFLRLFLNNKKIYIKNDRLTIDDAEAAGYEWLYAYYHVDDMENYLNSLNTEVVEDSSLNSVEISSEYSKDFERLGYLNDLLRNTVMYTKHTDFCGSYLTYMWYYRDVSDTSYMYINKDSMTEDELVLIWQPRSEDNVETEDMYLMGKNYYESNILK